MDGRLKPREHGAYAELTFPVVSGFVVGGLSWAGFGLALVATAFFMAHEPAAVLLGARGERLRGSLSGAARRLLSKLAVVALAAGVLFLATAPPAALMLTLLPAGFGAAVAGAVVLGRVKTLPGELLVAATFSSVHVPIAASAGATGLSLWVPALVWFTGFALATLAVHSLKYRFKGRGPSGWTVPAAPALAVLAVATGVAAPLVGPELAPAAAILPLGLAVAAVSLVPIHPRYLKRVGWTLVTADILTLVLLGLLLV